LKKLLVKTHTQAKKDSNWAMARSAHKNDTTEDVIRGIFENIMVLFASLPVSLRSLTGESFEIFHEMRGIRKIERKGNLGNCVIRIMQ
jgi:hypothetical protein